MLILTIIFLNNINVNFAQYCTNTYLSTGTSNNYIQNTSGHPGTIANECGPLAQGLYYYDQYTVYFTVNGDFSNSTISVNNSECNGWDAWLSNETECPYGELVSYNSTTAYFKIQVYHIYSFPLSQDLGWHPCQPNQAYVKYQVCKSLPALTFGSNMPKDPSTQFYQLAKGSTGYIFPQNTTNMNCFYWCLMLCDPNATCQYLPFNYGNVQSVTPNNGGSFGLWNVNFNNTTCPSNLNTPSAGAPYYLYEKLQVWNQLWCGTEILTSSGIQPLSRAIGGCPWMWVLSDSGLVPENNVFHKSEFSEFYGNDITDLYVLQNKPVFDNSGNFTIALSESSNDYTLFNQIQSYSVDHPEGTKIGVTENGDIVLYYTNAVTSTDSATLNNSSNITDFIQYNYSPSKIVMGHTTDSIFAHYDSSSQNKVFKSLKNAKRKTTSMVDIDSLALIGRLGHNQSYDYPTAPIGKSWAGVANIYTGSGEVSKNFARRENDADVIIPFGDISDNINDINIEFTNDYEVTYFSVVPVSYYGYTQTQLTLTSAEHSVVGDISSLVSNQDGNYAYLDTTCTITLKFQDLSIPSQGYVRDYVFMSNGHYLVPGGGTGTSGKNIVVNKTNQNLSAYTFRLYNNYPNPFNPKTSIKYSIQKDNNVTLNVYNTLGQLITTLVHAYQKAGEYEINFNGENYTSGIYFYRLESGDFVSTKKMVLIK